MGDNANILVGQSAGGSDGTGLIWFGATGTTAPTDATTALNAGFLNAGMISEDGITVSFSENSNQIRAYGTMAVQRTVVTEQEYTFSFRFLETNEVSVAVYHRKALTAIVPAGGTGAFSLTDGTYARQLYTAVVEVVDGSNKLRMYMPSVEVTNRGDFEISAGNPMGREVTLTAYPNSSGVAIQYFYAIPNLG